jgi:hypothetical protein
MDVKLEVNIFKPTILTGLFIILKVSPPTTRIQAD